MLQLTLLVGWTVPALAIALALSATGRATLRWRWLIAGAAAYGVYGGLSYLTLPADYLDMGAEHRWLSRLAALAVSLTIIGRWIGHFPTFDREALGLTFRQAPGSLPTSLLGIAVLAAIAALPGGVGWQESALPPGAYAYHLTIPGLEEELMYRAVLPALFALGVSATVERSRSYIGWGLVMGVMVMACGHAMVPRPDGSAGFDLFIFCYIGMIGAILADMRYRSGSLLLPIVGHNLVGLIVRLL